MIKKFIVFLVMLGLCGGVKAAQSIHDLIVFAAQTVASNTTVSVTNASPQIGVVKGYGVYTTGGGPVTSTVFTVRDGVQSSLMDSTGRVSTVGTPYITTTPSWPLLNEKITFTIISGTIATSSVTVTPYVIIEK